ncbi:hypothetical protein ACN38_g3337 [Penicillium nordicum]|uniref:Uncharacterized protein n=1 Tax=Penicillium nordicum TaxID=229535 RepID=A0A0M9WI63_9EURO|nr:hypothetical protein ACN38_g3337 [Penicillium nordicum]
MTFNAKPIISARQRQADISDKHATSKLRPWNWLHWKSNLIPRCCLYLFCEGAPCRIAVILYLQQHLFVSISSCRQHLSMANVGRLQLPPAPPVPPNLYMFLAKSSENSWTVPYE